MKVTDLMVGDWVNMGNPVTDELVPTKIENIYGEEINCNTDHTSDDVPTIIYGEWLRYAQPIPLTEDILVKNGWFALDEYRYEGDVALAKESSGFRLKNTNICVNSVHQLQHLLRLCGIKKELTI